MKAAEIEKHAADPEVRRLFRKMVGLQDSLWDVMREFEEAAGYDFSNLQTILAAHTADGDATAEPGELATFLLQLEEE